MIKIENKDLMEAWDNPLDFLKSRIFFSSDIHQDKGEYHSSKVQK